MFLWDVATARTLRRWEGHTGRVNAVAFAGEADSCVISGSFDASMKIWDGKSQSRKAIMSMGDAKDAVSSVLVLGHEIVAGSVDGRVRSYDIRMGRCTVDVVGYSVTSLAATKGGETLLVSTLDSRLRLFDCRDGTLLKAYADEGFVNESYRIRAALADNDKFVISGNEEGSIFVWDVLEGKVVKRLRHGAATEEGKSGKKDVVSAVVYCPGGRREWASAGGDGNVVIWGEGGD